VEYQGFTALFIEAFKEQQVLIESLTARVQALENK